MSCTLGRSLALRMYPHAALIWRDVACDWTLVPWPRADVGQSLRVFAQDAVFTKAIPAHGFRLTLAVDNPQVRITAWLEYVMTWSVAVMRASQSNTGVNTIRSTGASLLPLYGCSTRVRS